MLAYHLRGDPSNLTIEGASAGFELLGHTSCGSGVPRLLLVQVMRKMFSRRLARLRKAPATAAFSERLRVGACYARVLAGLTWPSATVRPMCSRQSGGQHVIPSPPDPWCAARLDAARAEAVKGARGIMAEDIQKGMLALSSFKKSRTNAMRCYSLSASKTL